MIIILSYHKKNISTHIFVSLNAWEIRRRQNMKKSCDIQPFYHEKCPVIRALDIIGGK